MPTIIKEKVNKIKRLSKTSFRKLWRFFISDTGFFILILILAMNISFFLGKLSSTTEEVASPILVQKAQQNHNDIEVVGSKKGSVFHYPWCSGATRIKPENTITFKNKKAAIDAGRRLAKNCEDV